MSDMLEEERRYRAVLALDPRSPRAQEELVRTLFDGSWRVRRAATEQLSAAGADPQLVPRLIDVLRQRGEAGARAAAAEALVQLKAAAVAPVVRLLAEGDADLRKLAVEVLGQLGAVAPLPALRHALDDVDVNVQTAAAEALTRVALFQRESGSSAAPRALPSRGLRPKRANAPTRSKTSRSAKRSKPGSPASFPFALELSARLAQANEPLQVALLTSLEQLREPLAFSTLAPLLKKPSLERVVLRLFGFCADASALEALAHAVLAPAPATRAASLAGIGYRAERAAPAARAQLDAQLAKLLGSSTHARAEAAAILADPQSERDVRRGALVLVSALGAEELWEPVVRAGLDELLQEEVQHALLVFGAPALKLWVPLLRELPAAARRVAGEALVSLATPAAVPLLHGLLDLGEPDLSLLAVRALGRTQSLEALPLLMPALGHASLSLAAVRALGLLAQRFPAQVLERLRKALSMRVNPSLLLAVGKIGALAALPELRRSLRDPDAAVRRAAVESAVHLGVEKGSALALLGLRDEDSAVRGAAIDAVGKLGAADAAPELERAVGAPEATVALAALRALSSLSRLGRPQLERALEHPDAEVLREALDLCPAESWVSKRAVQNLKHPSWAVRASAARAVVRVGRPDALPALETALAVETDALAKEALSDACEHFRA